MRVGILSFAHMHAYSYAQVLRQLKNIELLSVYDEEFSRGENYAAEFGAKYFSNIDDFLQDESLDAVIVCSENSKHKEHVMACAQAEKHILCEKPIATNVEDAQLMIDTCEKYNVLLQIAFPVRYSPPMARLRQIIQEGKIGTIRAMRGTNHGRNPGGWFIDPALSGGGAVLDHTVHIIDIMRWVLQSEVKEVFAEVDTKYSNILTDDCGLLTFEFENGVIASHDPSWSRPVSFSAWGDVTLKIVGTKGSVYADALAQHIDVYRNKNLHHAAHMWGEGYDFGLVSDFIDCIRTKRTPSITGYDGLKAAEVAFAAYESARIGQPVRLL
ncbi:Gfo/Idh/MocA family oxidoreductase [Pullulanibacillus sp. KACC 23026]|uniref:Gfo/Idh/MocA family protein n=1 Tax=Pullulanibacillus sp. KACC 23026 TaxID=3028315 RepID=UPI0023AEB52A|nr:Gfo/Idh/MocA family oxidoreductase [Pullulanibacillus sp. KACC 23026]WEG14944.1 Gfo/Idh/MocA family oxidoreductase [Pullulanibacillus sp. KACC 23026]